MVAVAGVLLAAAGCTARPAPRPVPSGSSAAPVASAVAGGCGRTSVLRGALPSWAVDAGPAGVPYVLSAEGNLVGVLFGAPLVAGTRTDGKANKVLWIVREPRDGSPLRLTGQPATGGTPTVTVDRAADSYPGEIYPSTVDVPVPGCWRFTAEWNGHTATVDLQYAPSS